MTMEATTRTMKSDSELAPVIGSLQLDILSQVEITGTREGGLTECWVPTHLIDHEEVPVKEEHALALAIQMDEVASVRGGSGQLSPLILGRIKGEDTLKIVDGFHRDAALKIKGETLVYATIAETTWDELYDYRIFTAKDHRQIRFSRVVQWIREVWEYSGLADKLTVEQAVLLYRYNTPGTRLGLNPQDVEAAKSWVQRKEQQWDMAAMTIHSHLKVAENVDPGLVHSAREKISGHVLTAPTQNILKVFSDLMPSHFELQNLVMDTAKQHNLKAPEVKALCQTVLNCTTLKMAQVAIDKIDWTTWKPQYSDDTMRKLRRAGDARFRGAAVFNKIDSELAVISQRTRLSLERGEELDEAMIDRLKEALVRSEKITSELGSLAVALSELISLPPTLKAPPTAAASAPRIAAAQPQARANNSSRALRTVSRVQVPNRRTSPGRPSTKDLDSFEKSVSDHVFHGTNLPFITSFKEASRARRVYLHAASDPETSAEVRERNRLLGDAITRAKDSLSL